MFPCRPSHRSASSHRFGRTETVVLNPVASGAAEAECPAVVQQADVLRVDAGLHRDSRLGVVATWSRSLVARRHSCRREELPTEGIRAVGLRFEFDRRVAPLLDGDNRSSLPSSKTVLDSSGHRVFPDRAGPVVRFEGTVRRTSRLRRRCAHRKGEMHVFPGLDREPQVGLRGGVVYTGSTQTSFAPFSTASRSFEASCWRLLAKMSDPQTMTVFAFRQSTTSLVGTLKKPAPASRLKPSPTLMSMDHRLS